MAEALQADLGARLNSKHHDHSLLMHESDGNRYWCPWIEDSMTIHADGNVTCGVDDPFAQRSFGNVKDTSVADIFANPVYERLRQGLRAGRKCFECGLAQRTSGRTSARENARPRLPHTLVIEPTIVCNIRCNNDTCIVNNDPSLKVRSFNFLEFDVFVSVINQLKESLKTVYFFNYGEPFVHPKAEDMLLYLRNNCPDAHIITSTNGIPLAKIERAKRVVTAQPNFMVFTIGGITQESYSRYHKQGRSDLALKGMLNVLLARNDLGLNLPVINWRYLLFNWNDSDEEISEAIRIAEENGVNQFSLYLTHVPDDGISYRFSPGSPLFTKYRRYIANSLGFTDRAGTPDSDGFYPLESVAGLGPARWTGWQAKRRIEKGSRSIDLSLSTTRPRSKSRVTHMFIVTPWSVLKVRLISNRWRSISIRVPTAFDQEAFDIYLVTDSYWFPKVEMGVPDYRCLGGLVREAQRSVGPIGRFVSRLMTGLFYRASAREKDHYRAFRFSASDPLLEENSGRLERPRGS
ncbi:MAG: SPASM domain-containing protein [Brevundimonas sp.]|nr:SPASM domain-containing protein [Brevundimonas sp.]